MNDRNVEQERGKTRSKQSHLRSWGGVDADRIRQVMLAAFIRSCYIIREYLAMVRKLAEWV